MSRHPSTDAAWNNLNIMALCQRMVIDKETMPIIEPRDSTLKVEEVLFIVAHQELTRLNIERFNEGGHAG